MSMKFYLNFVNGSDSFAHVRNIKYLSDNGLDFYEAPHKSEYGSLDMYKILKQCTIMDLMAIFVQIMVG